MKQATTTRSGNLSGIWWKTLLSTLFLGFVAYFMLGISHEASAAEAQKIIVYINNEDVDFTIDPVAKNGTTLVQMRTVFEELNMNVHYDQKTKKITATKEGYRIELTLNKSTAIVNGKQVKLLQPATTVKGNTLVPLRFISEATGALVHWNGPGKEIFIFSQDFFDENGITRAQVKKILDDAQKEIDKKYADYKKQQKEKEKKKPVEKVDLNKLNGMYFGSELDLAGYECGGLCWKFYTFLPGKKVVIGEPVSGGPEKIDCKKDKCLSYTIKNGKIVLSNGKSLTIGKNKNGALVINKVHLEKVKPMKNNLRLNGEYVTRGYSGLVGIHPISTSWSKYITFKSDGTFVSDHIWLKAGSNNNVLKGTYKISGNTLTLNYSNGKKSTLVIYGTPNSNGTYNELQIGDRSFDKTK